MVVDQGCSEKAKEDTVQVLAAAVQGIKSRLDDLENRLEPVLIEVPPAAPTVGGTRVHLPEPMSTRRSALLGIADELRFTSERLGSIVHRIDL
jgi:hypothetical protein